MNVADYGAVGDGVTNDTDAFSAAAAVLSSNGGGTFYIPPGNYILGKQTFAGESGKGYSYKSAPMVNITGCIYPVTIQADNARLTMAPDLKYGSFDPVTGEVFEPALPFYDGDYEADLGYMFNILGNRKVTFVGDLELDGNCEDIQMGGLWGDKGRQIPAYGVRFANNREVRVLGNLYTHHHCLDGVYMGQYVGYDATEPRPALLTNITSEYNCRQGLSLTGGSSITIQNCKFSYTGKAMSVSAPGAGVDIEAELGKVRNVAFVDCDFIDNTGCGLVADAGDIADVTFSGCNFSGHNSQVLWPKKPRMVFDSCSIDGALVNAYGSSSTPGDSTVFSNCNFTDDTLRVHSPSAFRLIDTVNFPGVTFNDCSFTSVSGRYSDFRDAILNDCTFMQRAGTETIQPDKFQVILLWGSTVTNLTVIDEITNAPTSGYFIGLSGTTMDGTNYIHSQGSIKWKNWSTGYTGLYTG